MLGLEDAAIPEERIEDAGEATGEGDDGHLFAAARGDAQGPGPQRLGLRRVPAKEGDGGLNHYTSFRDFQFALFDGHRRVVAIGNSIPFGWDGRPAHLPERIADLLARGIDDRGHGRRPTALSALAAIVEERHRGLGLSARVIRAMAQLAARHRLRYLVAPVRPTLKGDYPLTPIEHYAGWTDGTGGPFDPWLRVHWRLGARTVGIARRANTVPASVAAWQEWTGLRFPESGRYIVPGAFQPIRVDRERDRVHYEEANVWMLHPRPRAGAATTAEVSGRRRVGERPTRSPRAAR